MSGAKFTPGPWHRGSDDLNSRECWSEVYADNGWTVARVNVGQVRFSERAGVNAIARASADLIAAAPDLLEALQVAMRYVGGEGTDDEVDLCRAAIARATGQQGGLS